MGKVAFGGQFGGSVLRAAKSWLSAMDPVCISPWYLPRDPRQGSAGCLAPRCPVRATEVMLLRPGVEDGSVEAAVLTAAGPGTQRTPSHARAGRGGGPASGEERCRLSLSERSQAGCAGL